jgi:uncharacterized protein YjdB
MYLYVTSTAVGKLKIIFTPNNKTKDYLSRLAVKERSDITYNSTSLLSEYIFAHAQGKEFKDLTDSGRWEGASYDAAKKELKLTYTPGKGVLQFLNAANDTVTGTKAIVVTYIGIDQKVSSSDGLYTYEWPKNNSADFCGAITIEGLNVSKGQVIVLGIGNASPKWSGLELTPSNATDVLPTSVAITGIPSQAAVGTSYPLGATVLPDNATSKSVTWSVQSGNAAITSAGVVTATAVGTVVVRAASIAASSVYADSTIAFTNRAVTGVTVSGAPSGEFYVGDSVQLAAAVAPSDATVKAVAWSVASGTAVTVDPATGWVKGVAAGVATVRATAADGSAAYGEATITVLGSVKWLSGITISGGVSAVKVGETSAAAFTVSVVPADATVQTCTVDLVESGGGRALLNAERKITGVAVGNVSLRAVAQDERGTYVAYAPVVVLPAASAVVGSGEVSTEALVIYENFGGVNPSENGITPEKWPPVYADSGKHSGWQEKTESSDDGKNDCLVKNFYNNGFFHVDSLKKYRTGGTADLGIEISATSNVWKKSVPLRNGYQTGKDRAFGFEMAGIAAMPEFDSYISYGATTPDFQKSINRADERGYLYFGKPYGTPAINPRLTIPSELDYLPGVTRIEAIISGSRFAMYNNTFIAFISHLDASGRTLRVDTFTYSVALTPRSVNIPVAPAEDEVGITISFESRGAGTSNVYTDFSTSANNTETAEPHTFNRSIFTTNNTTANPGLQLHSLKVYAKASRAGYSVTAPGGVTLSKSSGIAHGETVTATAEATKSGKNFVGWNISEREALSEVNNPLAIIVTKSLSLTPVYVGDEVLLPVVNENFTSWKQEGAVVTADAVQGANGLLNYAAGEAVGGATGKVDKVVRVPLRYGFTSGGQDSIDITLKACYVMPSSTVRTSNVPGAGQWRGFVAFSGPATSKGYVEVAKLEGVERVEVELSPYDNVHPQRAAAILVNDQIVRNKILSTFYAEKVGVATDPARPVKLKVGYATQSKTENFRDDLATGSAGNANATIVALHSLKMYAKVTLPDHSYYQLTTLTTESGKSSVSVSPSADNSSGKYPAGAKVEIRANAASGFGFDGWEDENGASLGSDNPLQVTMDASKTVKANFARNPSYVVVTASPYGTVTSVPLPERTSGDTLEFLAGVPVTLTATPSYGHKAVSWTKESTVVNNTDASKLSFNLSLSATELVKDGVIHVAPAYEDITEEVTVAVKNDTVKGNITFDLEPVSVRYSSDTAYYTFPKATSIQFTATPKYSWGFSSYSNKADFGNDTTSATITVVMNKDKNTTVTWAALSRRLLIVTNDDPNGTVTITDEHAAGEQEQAGRWPTEYEVKFTATPNNGYELASPGDVSYNNTSETEFVVFMNMDTVIVTPVFIEKREGVTLLLSENFQNAARWPQSPATLSNVAKVRADFPSLSETWTPTSYNSNLKALLDLIAEYRVWSSDNDPRGDGPGSPTLDYQQAPLARRVAVSPGSRDSLTITVASYAPCNDCMIKKAVKAANTSNLHLGHVTAGMVALKRPTIKDGVREQKTQSPFTTSDTVGMMLIEGMAYVKEVEVGYVSSASQFCPSVYWTIEGGEIIEATGQFVGDYGNFQIIGQKDRPDYNNYDGRYGWGSSTEGMIMDQEMDVRYDTEQGVEETKILIAPGYKLATSAGKTTYSYSDVYIHDLKIWGSMKQISEPSGIRSLISSKAKSVFYLLGSTNVLKVEAPEQVKAIVLYNEVGTCIGVYKGYAADNQITVNGLRPGVYGAHAYTVDGKMYKGGFIKVNE